MGCEVLARSDGGAIQTKFYETIHNIIIATALDQKNRVVLYSRIKLVIIHIQY